MTDNTKSIADDEPVAEFATIESVFVRKRNCLLLRGDFSPVFVDYYLHLMQHALHPAEEEATILKQLLAYFTLHLVSRPWKEHHAWTLNLREPLEAGFFVCGSSLTEEVVGRSFTEGLKLPQQNTLYAQNLVEGRDPQTSVITLSGTSPAAWAEQYYAQSEQRSARAFALAGDSFALLTAEPDADEAWLASLTAEDVAAIGEHEETKQLETRRFRFHCGCSVDRLLPTIRSLRSNFEDLLAEQGYILANCPRCGAAFRITRDMLDTEKPSK